MKRKSSISWGKCRPCFTNVKESSTKITAQQSSRTEKSFGRSLRCPGKSMTRTGLSTPSMDIDASLGIIEVCVRRRLALGFSLRSLKKIAVLPLWGAWEGDFERRRRARSGWMVMAVANFGPAL